MSEPVEKELLNSPYAKFAYKLAIAAFLVGGAVYRYEQKMDEIGNRLIKKIDEHILADGFEKKELNAKIIMLEKQVANMQDEAKDYFKHEFIKPEAPRLKEEHE